MGPKVPASPCNKVPSTPSKDLSDREKKALLRFIIHNQVTFKTSDALFEAAKEKFQDRDAKFLRTKYSGMTRSNMWKQVFPKMIPAHELTIEQKFKIALLEEIRLEPKFVRDVLLPHFDKKENENLVEGVQSISLAERNETGESSSAINSVEVENTPESSVSTNQQGASVTPISAGKRGPGRPKKIQ
ncbi:unnamed protein product [Caenorhabditis nigoni]